MDFIRWCLHDVIGHPSDLPSASPSFEPLTCVSRVRIPLSGRLRGGLNRLFSFHLHTIEPGSQHSADNLNIYRFSFGM